MVHSKGHTVGKNLRRSAEIEGRNIRAHSDTGWTSEPPSSLKAASTRSIMAGAAEPPSPLVAGASMSQCQQALAPVGKQGGGVGCKRGENQSRSSPSQTPLLTPQTYSLSLPLQLHTTRKVFTVTDYSEYTKTPCRIPNNFVLSCTERKHRTREMGNKKEVLGVPQQREMS